MALLFATRRDTGRRPRAPGPRLGNWKLAYADFLTALVALFLVLWLVSDAQSEGRADIAGYFRGEAQAQTALAATTPEKAATDLASALRNTRRLTGLSTHLNILPVGDRVRIDLMDRLSQPLFENNGAELTESGREAVATLSAILQDGDWPVEIEGHTDAFPTLGARTDNWTLSSQRAHAARRALVASGLAEDRVRAVTGLADTHPLRPEEPHLAANRRVTLILQVRS
ncbi:MAG: OmpA family protein [Hyphomonadaceae bacterium]|nr:OmpA family protein [Hyphomonadaceae bacterium]